MPYWCLFRSEQAVVYVKCATILPVLGWRLVDGIADIMDHSAEHVREMSSTLYKYHLDNFLCDVFIVLPDGTEVPAHSVVLSAVSDLV